jgi:molecular chaperone HtpG
MQMIQGSGLGDFPESYNVVVNANHPLIAEKILNVTDTEEREKLVSHLYDLARLNQGMLKGKELTAFINKSLSLI